MCRRSRSRIRNRAAACICDIGEASVWSDGDPTGSGLIRADRCADRRQGAVPIDVIRRRSARILGSAKRFGHEQLVTLAKREAERRLSTGVLHTALTGQAMPADLERDDPVSRLLRHHEHVAVRCEGDLRRIGGSTTERPLRSVQRTQATVSPERESGNAVASGVEHKDEATVLRHAHRPNSTARLNLHETEAATSHLQDGNGVAGGIHRKQPLFVAAQDEPTLVPSPAPVPVPPVHTAPAGTRRPSDSRSKTRIALRSVPFDIV